MKKAIVVCFCAFVLCLSAVKVEGSSERGGNYSSFYPKLPCGYRCSFNATYTRFSDVARIFSWLSKYNVYEAEYRESRTNDRLLLKDYKVARPDLHGQHDPQTAAMFVGEWTEGYEGTCELAKYVYFEDLVNDFFSEESYFIIGTFPDGLAYTSMNESDEWEGSKCKSYTNDFGGQDIHHKNTFYVNDEDLVIGVFIEYSSHATLRMSNIKYEMEANAGFFSMPDIFSGCDKAVYNNPGADSYCPLEDAAASSIKTTVAIVLAAMMICILAFF